VIAMSVIVQEPMSQNELLYADVVEYDAYRGRKHETRDDFFHVDVFERKLGDNAKQVYRKSDEQYKEAISSLEQQNAIGYVQDIAKKETPFLENEHSVAHIIVQHIFIEYRLDDGVMNGTCFIHQLYFRDGLQSMKKEYDIQDNVFTHKNKKKDSTDKLVQEALEDAKFEEKERLRQEKAESERKAKEEAERKEKEEAERKAKEEAERKAKEQETKDPKRAVVVNESLQEDGREKERNRIVREIIDKNKAVLKQGLKDETKMNLRGKMHSLKDILFKHLKEGVRNKIILYFVRDLLEQNPPVTTLVGQLKLLLTNMNYHGLIHDPRSFKNDEFPQPQGRGFRFGGCYKSKKRSHKARRKTKKKTSSI
jgi:hypothetical protein